MSFQAYSYIYTHLCERECVCTCAHAHIVYVFNTYWLVTLDSTKALVYIDEWNRHYPFFWISYLNDWYRKYASK